MASSLSENKSALPTAEEIIQRVTGARRIDRTHAVIAAQGLKGADVRPRVQAALDDCSRAGGGRVVLAAGDHFCAGPIHLRSLTELHLETGSRLVFSDDPAHYLPIVFMRWAGTECFNYSPFLYAFRQHDIAITGAGLIEGQGESWWSWKRDGRDCDESIQVLRRMGEEDVPVEQRKFGPAGRFRPPLFSPHYCQGVTVDGPTFSQSPFWSFCPTYCENVLVRNVTVIGHGVNTDGMTADSCRDVVFERIRLDVGDDAFVIKSGYNRDGRRVGIPTENVVIRDSEVVRGHSLIAIGSETSGDIRNIHVQDCVATGPDIHWAIHVKSRPGRGGLLSEMQIRRIKLGDVHQNLLRLNLDYAWNGPRMTGELPAVDGLLLEDIEVKRTGKHPLFVHGLADSRIRRLALRRVRVAETVLCSHLAHVDTMTWEQVDLAPPPEAQDWACNDF